MDEPLSLTQQVSASTHTKHGFLPTYWIGDDAAAMPGGVCELDWDFIVEELAVDVGYDAYKAHNTMIEMAARAQVAGDKQKRAWFVCHGLAALNYMDQIYG